MTPAEIALLAISSLPVPAKKTKGRSGCFSRTARRNSGPFVSGMSYSLTTQSNRSSATSRSSPSLAFASVSTASPSRSRRVAVDRPSLGRRPRIAPGRDGRRSCDPIRRYPIRYLGPDGGERIVTVRRRRARIRRPRHRSVRSRDRNVPSVSERPIHLRASPGRRSTQSPRRSRLRTALRLSHRRATTPITKAPSASTQGPQGCGPRSVIDAASERCRFDPSIYRSVNPAVPSAEPNPRSTYLRTVGSTGVVTMLRPR